jgi:hypothetical protein
MKVIQPTNQSEAENLSNSPYSWNWEKTESANLDLVTRKISNEHWVLSFSLFSFPAFYRYLSGFVGHIKIEWLGFFFN